MARRFPTADLHHRAAELLDGRGSRKTTAQTNEDTIAAFRADCSGARVDDPLTLRCSRYACRLAAAGALDGDQQIVRESRQLQHHRSAERFRFDGSLAR